MAKLRFIDIGANLTDSMYSGVYNGSKKHEPDLKSVLDRSWAVGMERIIITGGSLEESKKALELAQTDDRLYATVGCHPTRCLQFEQNPHYLDSLKELIINNKSKVIALGECGLDYDRLQFCSKDVQLKYFQLQLELCKAVDLPLFLHCRNSTDDLYEIISRHSDLRGVVHSFDGSFESAKRFIGLGYYIGLNGCSLKTKDNLDTVAKLPNNRILLETDCPWCEIRPTHAGHGLISKKHSTITSLKKEKWRPDCIVKNRNEPMNIRQVLDIVSAVKNEDPSTLCHTIYENTKNLFFDQS